MMFEVKAIVTDEFIATEGAPCVRMWIRKHGEEKEDERVFLLPKQFALTEENPLFIMAVALDQAGKHRVTEAQVERGKKAAVKKAAKEKPEEKKDEG